MKSPLRFFGLRRTLARPAIFPLAISCLAASGTALAQQTTLTPGNLVVAVEGCGVYGGTCVVPNGTGTAPSGSGSTATNSSLGGYGDNQAAPLTLFQYAPIGTTAATYVNSLVLPQVASRENLPVSGEYGSSSEATLHLSGNGQYLSLLGYGINAATFNANPTQYGAAPSLALAQSGSLSNQSAYTPVARVLALIDANGTVTSSTAVENIFNTNNPRSAFTANGTSAYLSGQGAKNDTTGGVFLVHVGAKTTVPTAITGNDATGNTVSQDTRDIQIVNNTLYTSVDSKAGSGNARCFVGTVGVAQAVPVSLAGGGAPIMLPGFGNAGGTGQVTINNNGNGINANGQTINVSPEGFFFASPSILYVADSGDGKQTSATTTLGDGGLQKWINTKTDGTGIWNLAYTLSKGLSLVPNNKTDGVSGLYGLTGQVGPKGQVLLYATSYTLADLDQTYLYGITDALSDTTAAQAADETFSVLAAAPKDSNFKGVSFAPTFLAPVNLLPTITVGTPAGSGSFPVVNVALLNQGQGTAQGVTLTSVKVGAQTVVVPSAPVSLPPIVQGGSTAVTLPLSSVPALPGAVVPVNVTGFASAETFSFAVRVVVPNQ